MGSINRDILALAWPAIVSNITTPLLGLVDTAIVGHVGAIELAAIAVGGTMVSTLYWIFNFLRMGTGGLTAQAYGANSYRAQRTVLAQSLIIAIGVGLALILCRRYIADVGLWLIDADDLTAFSARRYFEIVLPGAPAMLASYALCGWFLGMQDSRTPMWMAVVTNLSNIVLSITFVFGMKMKIEGVAMGTLASQYIGVAVGCLALRRKYGIGPVAAIRGADSLSAGLSRFLRVNADIFMRTLCLVAVTLWFTHAGAGQGSVVLGANALLLQLFMLFSFFIDGFAFSAEALSGRHYGAGDMLALRATVRALAGWGAALALAFAAIYISVGDYILALLTSQTAVRDIAMQYLPWAALVPAAGVAAFIFDGIFIGLTLTRAMLASMAAAMAVFFTIYTLAPMDDANDSLWLAFNLYLFMRGAVQFIVYKCVIARRSPAK
ncbi:MAG: MATE family efflux transporter [Muribaculaceae bacterium]